MAAFFKRLIYTLSNKIARKKTGIFPDVKYIVDFSKTKKSPFDIKSESSYNAYLSNNSLEFGLKKSNYIAWLEIPGYEFHDHVIEAKIRLDSLGGYASAGLLFHIMDSESYYLALVSSKGYFRLDVVKDGAPRTLIAWTEFTDFDGTNINLNIITYGTYLHFIVNGKWLGETNDDTISSGGLGFALASYEAAPAAATTETVSTETVSNETVSTETVGDETASTETTGSETAQTSDTDKYTCKAWLDFFSVDSRINSIEENFKKWNDNSGINAESRLRLAETFAVMGEYSKALDQIDRAWKRRDEAIRGVAADDASVKTRKELLLAARMSLGLGHLNEANEFIDAIIEQSANDPQRLVSTNEGREALKEKMMILNELGKFAELKKFTAKYSRVINKDINFYTRLARCHWELKDYKNSAVSWEKAFGLNRENGVYLANAGNALELAGKKDEALGRFIEAGKIFLRDDNVPELAALMPKLAALGEKNWEARALAGKCAFSIEDYNRSAAEFSAAEKLRRSLKPRPKADPALYYLWGLVSNIKGRNSDAIRLLERAVKLAPDYGLFRFKLTEIKINSGMKDPKFAEEFRLAIEQIGDDPDGKMTAHARSLLVASGDAKSAKHFMEEPKKK
jgi:tetratricopeptide (TPR) repeat protein